MLIQAFLLKFFFLKQILDAYRLGTNTLKETTKQSGKLTRLIIFKIAFVTNIGLSAEAVDEVMVELDEAFASIHCIIISI